MHVFPTTMSVSKNENATNLAKVWRVVEGGKYCASGGQSLRQTATFLELYWNAQTNSNFQAPPLSSFAMPEHTLPKLKHTLQFSAFQVY